ncbi:MAG TPA: hypothetical protein VF815_00135, partial [Myxococcaceae bacterium]
MPELKPPEMLQKALTHDPYKNHEARLVAFRLPEMEEPISADTAIQPSTQKFLEYGDQLWALMRAVIQYWTPARMEQEALRRASSEISTSVIAEEVAVFTAAYMQWHPRAVDAVSFWDKSNNYHGTRIQTVVVKTRMVLAALSETLSALERRAASMEARATDLRLRYEFHQLRQELARRELSSHIVTAIREAAKNPDSEQHLKSIVDKISGLEERFAKFHGELEFIADHTTHELMASGAFDAPEKKAVKALAKAG